MATKKTAGAIGLTQQIIMNDGNFKINPTYSIEVTQNSDQTANFTLSGHVTDPNEVNNLVAFTQGQIITPGGGAPVT